MLLAVFLPFLISCAGYRSALLPRISVGEQYTDNVALAPSNPKPDYISTVSPEITYYLTGPTKGLELSYDPSFIYYADAVGGGQGQFGNRQSASLNAWDQLEKHSRLTVTDTFIRTDDPVPFIQPVFTQTNQPTPPIDTTIRTSRAAYETNFVNTAFRQDFGRNDSFTFNYTNTILTNEDPTIQNNMTHSPSVDLAYWFNSQYGIDLKAAYTRGDFSVQQGTPDPSINETVFSSRFLRKISPDFNIFLQCTDTNMDFEGASATQVINGNSATLGFTDYHVYDVSAGGDYHLSPTVFLTASGGYYFFDVDEGKPKSGYEAHADMAKQFKWGSVRLTGDVGYGESFFGAQDLGFTQYYGSTLAGTYSFSQRLTGLASGSYRNSDYLQVSPGNTQTTTTLLAGLTYQLRPSTSVAVHFTHSIADSNVETNGIAGSTSGTGSYNENRASLILTFVPREPYLLGR